MRATRAEVKFFNHGGTHLPMLEQAGIESEDLLPAISDKQDRIVMDINQFKAPLGTPLPFGEQELVDMVEADLAALREYKPDGVYCGLNFSSMISVPHSGLPMVTQVPTSLCPAFYQRRLASFPATMETNFVIRHLVPGWVKRRLFNAVMQKDVMARTAGTFNQVRKRYGLAPIHNPIEFVRADLVLLPDLPELSGLPEEDLPAGYQYTGPIFAHMDVPMPPQVRRIFAGDGTRVFCTLGSSGTPEVFMDIVKTLKSVPGFRIVCATTTIMDPAGFGPESDRFFATRYLPAHQVHEMADIAITHGGQGTIQAAAWAGTPVVGIGFQAEQQANIDGLARAGAAIRIPLHSVTPKRLLTAISRLSEPGFRSNALSLRAIVRRHDGVKASVAAMNRLINR